MEENYYARIQAMKRLESDPKYLVACDLEDEAAIRYTVSWPNPLQTNIEVDNKLLAERIRAAMQAAFNAGRVDMQNDLQRMLGIK